MQQSSRNAPREGRRRGTAILTGLAALALLAALLIGGCGSDEQGSSTTVTTGSGTETGAEPTAEADVADADPGDVEVIDGWIEALSDGDTEAAGGYFAIPSTVENVSVLTKLETADDAIAFNESLPCGGTLVAAKTTGDFTTATFELTDRPGGDCGAGTGTKASTSFVIEDGKITDWRRVAGPGDEQSSPAGQGGEIS
jgi:hypothetical protein